MNYELKESNYAKRAQKVGKYQVLFFKNTRTNFCKTSNPEELFWFEYEATEKRTWWSTELYQGNGTTETIEELENLCQTLGDEKGCVIEIGEEQDMIM